MSDMYSTYDAKAKFSEILRKVREGRTVTVSYRGEPIAEIRPLPKEPDGLPQRLDRLADLGVLVRPGKKEARLKTVARRPGALERFLSDRDG